MMFNKLMGDDHFHQNEKNRDKMHLISQVGVNLH